MHVAAGAGSAQLDLDDDACSTTASRQACQVPQPEAESLEAGRKRVKLSDGSALVAETFWHDFAARGSVYQYCLQ
jgi:hypothetical protein